MNRAKISTSTTFTLSPEQEVIVKEAKQGDNLAIKALAGCAKTTTAVEIAKACGKSTLYLAYNKSISVEAQEKFGYTAECRTIHSLAYRSVVVSSKYKNKLAGNISRTELMKNLTDVKKVSKEVLLLLVEDIEKLLSIYTVSTYVAIEDVPNFSKEVTKQATLFWEKMIDTTSPTAITHNTYLKLFWLGGPVLNYDLYIVDEAQDLNPLSLDIIMQQEGQKVFIGDPYQAIYAFNGAVDAFSKLLDYKTLPLSSSYRFPQRLADTSLPILKKAGYKGKFLGKGKEREVLTYAILAKTNISLFLEAKRLAEKGHSLHIIGGFKELKSLLYSAMALKAGNLQKVYDKTLKEFKSFDDLIDTAKTRTELGKLITILSTVDNLPNVLNCITNKLVPMKDNPEFILSTIHKSKGLEFDHVTIQDGLIPITKEFLQLSPKDKLTHLKETQLLNLIYIAITRASCQVELPFDLLEFFFTKRDLA